MTMLFEQHTLDSARHLFRSLKASGDRTLEQLDREDLLWVPYEGGNSIAVIVRHLHGNMLSRWTDFLTTDGEKPWRDRDSEFVQPEAATLAEMMGWWEAGWHCLFQAVDGLTAEVLSSKVTIRGQEHTVIEALHRQIQHISYHLGQIVLLARMRKQNDWRTLSIPRGASKSYRPGSGLGESGR
jgi:uncharacterized damage-inducible protein DinB